MGSNPILNLTRSGLKITTVNSKVDSALLIYKIESEINQSRKEIYLKGYQALGKKFKNEFPILLSKEILEDIRGYKIYWLDPDEKKNLLEIKGFSIP